MKKYYLAVDIGASSGRHILGWMENDKIQLEEVYRFDNGMEKKDDFLCWDVEKLFNEIKSGLKCCREIGKIPCSMGIDTWAVDFVLLDKTGKMLGNAVGYRDKRTQEMDEEVYRIIPETQLYQRTGIQKQIFNTIYQLMAIKKQSPDLFCQAQSLLLIPDYFNYLLTGVKKTEYTNATTTQLVSPMSKNWDLDLLNHLGYPVEIFGDISLPGTKVGRLLPELKQELGFDLTVYQVASHDTASAVVSVPARSTDFLYISSGTWSLMGVERSDADCSRQSQQANFTNEGGFQYRFRYLKNIMGLWMIQSARHEWKDQYSFTQLCTMADQNSHFPSRVDVNHQDFLAPESMIKAIQKYCQRSGQQIPETVGQISAVIYHSLADSYAQTATEIEQLTNQQYDSINIVGGGSNADYLNQLTAQVTHKTIYSGPTEATAIGNLTVQMLEDKQFKTLEQARETIYNSFPIKTYHE